MNHRTHSGNTIVSNTIVNAIEKPTINIVHTPAASNRTLTKPTDFDAIQSIPFDNNVIATTDYDRQVLTPTIDDESMMDDTPQISVVFKKLSSYFSSSQKTLINLTNNRNNSNSDKNSCNSIDACAVFENCNVVLSPPPSPLPVSTITLSTSKVSIANNKQRTINRNANDNQSMVQQQLNSNNHKNKTNLNSSSSNSSLRSNSMKQLCGDKRDVDKCDEIFNKKQNKNTNKIDKIDYGVDGRTKTMTTARTIKRAQKSDGTPPQTGGDSFTLPRVTLRPR